MKYVTYERNDGVLVSVPTNRIHTIKLEVVVAATSAKLSIKLREDADFTDYDITYADYQRLATNVQAAEEYVALSQGAVLVAFACGFTDALNVIPGGLTILAVKFQDDPNYQYYSLTADDATRVTAQIKS